ncbi:hypothetical protein TCAL_09632, partial [Tigriopus californicus]
STQEEIERNGQNYLDCIRCPSNQRPSRLPDPLHRQKECGCNVKYLYSCLAFCLVVQNNPKVLARVSSSPFSMRSNYTDLIGPGAAFNPDPVADVVGSGPGTRSELISRLAQNHPLCIDNVTAYVGQTARMFCCLARLERELSVSWIRKQDVVVLTHGHSVFTTDNRVTASSHNGVWALNIAKVGHADAGLYECQTNSEVKGSITIQLDIMETTAEIMGPTEKYVKVGSSLRLTCRVYLGPQGPDQDYRETAVVHWFQDQRLLDPILDSWRPAAGAVESGTHKRVTISSEFVHDELQGYLQVDNVTPYDAGNYTCVPSYAIPDWVQVHILHEENQARLHNEVSEVKVDVSTANSAVSFLNNSHSYRSVLSKQMSLFILFILTSLILNHCAFIVS